MVRSALAQATSLPSGLAFVPGQNQLVSIGLPGGGQDIAIASENRNDNVFNAIGFRGGVRGSCRRFPGCAFRKAPTSMVSKQNGLSRRDVIKATGTVAAASALAGVALPQVHAGGSDIIRLALVGCGGRGTGAAE